MFKGFKMLPASYWLIAFAILFNMIQFRAIDKQNMTAYKAIYRYETDDIIAISMRSITVRTHWLSTIALSRVAPESHILIPENFTFETEEYISWLHSFGQVASTKFVGEVDGTRLLENINLEQFVVASGENMLRGKPYFAIAMKDGQNSNLRRDQIAGLSITDTQPVMKEASFLLLRWQGPDEPFSMRRQKSTAPYYVLFLDTRLLPTETRLEILQ